MKEKLSRREFMTGAMAAAGAAAFEGAAGAEAVKRMTEEEYRAWQMGDLYPDVVEQIDQMVDAEDMGRLQELLSTVLQKVQDRDGRYRAIETLEVIGVSTSTHPENISFYQEIGSPYVDPDSLDIAFLVNGHECAMSLFSDWGTSNKYVTWSYGGKFLIEPTDSEELIDYFTREFTRDDHVFNCVAMS